MSYDKTFVIKHMVTNRHGYIGKTEGNMKGLDGQILNRNGVYVQINLRCSWHMIKTKLKNIPSWFGLNYEKEVWMPELSKLEVMEKEWVYIKKAISYIKSKDGESKQKRIKRFIDSIHKLDRESNVCYIKGDMFNFKLYTDYYCIRDSQIIGEAMEIWRKTVNRLSNNRICIYDVLTIPQLVYNLLYIWRGFEDIYEYRLHPREFMSRCEKGGVCMTRDNHMWKVDIPIVDLDVNGQYAKAMVDMIGIVKGLAKVIDVKKMYSNINITEIYNASGYFNPSKELVGIRSKKMYNELAEYDYSMMEIKVYGVNKRLHFPVLSDRTGNVVDYTNDYTGIYYCDIVELKDLIQYHDLEWELIRGYYFDEGRNANLSILVSYLTAYRNTLRQEGNGMQKMIKLLINSLYGRMGMKPIRKDYIVIYGIEEKDKFINRYCKFVLKCTPITKTMFFIKVIKSISMHYSIPQGSSNVLSISKTNMNLVKYICDKHDILIFYTDTDSLHVEADKIPLLEHLYEEYVGKKLVGILPGQFSIDYDPSDMIRKDGGQYKYVKGRKLDLVAIRAYYLAKKFYINQINDDQFDPYIGVVHRDIYYHIRAKGIGPYGITDGMVEFSDLYINRDQMETYEMLYQGIPTKFDSVKAGKVCFQYKDDLSVLTRNDFFRTVWFPGSIIESGVRIQKNKHIRYHVTKDRVVLQDTVWVSNDQINDYMLDLRNYMKSKDYEASLRQTF